MRTDTINLRKFPDNEYEALAFLYLKNQDLSDKSPSEFYDIYKNAYDEIILAKKTGSKEVNSNPLGI